LDYLDFLSFTQLLSSQVAQLLSDYWTSCAELRRELEALVRPYPHEFSTTASISGDSSTFQVTIPVLYHHLKAKAFITFIFDAETYSNWPFSINNVGINVSVGYGLLR
jgi:kinetochore protein Spc7/SPC105